MLRLGRRNDNIRQFQIALIGEVLVNYPLPKLIDSVSSGFFQPERAAFFDLFWRSPFLRLRSQNRGYQIELADPDGGIVSEDTVPSSEARRTLLYASAREIPNISQAPLDMKSL